VDAHNRLRPHHQDSYKLLQVVEKSKSSKGTHNSRKVHSQTLCQETRKEKVFPKVEKKKPKDFGFCLLITLTHHLPNQTVCLKPS